MRKTIKRVLKKVNRMLKHRFPGIHTLLKRLKNNALVSKRRYSSLLLSRYERLKPSEEQHFSFQEDVRTKMAVYSRHSKALAVSDLLSKVDINPEENTFFYNIDVFKFVIDLETLMVNSTFDYEKIIYGALDDFLIDGNDKFAKESNTIIHGLLNYLHRIVDYVNNSTLKNKESITIWLSNMENSKATSFPEALQRILFFNMVLWQTNHRLVGLGRLDLILDKIYKSDSEITKEKAIYYIMEFLKCLHRYYWFKSNELLGDTGQIIILGGNNENGDYFYNELTFAFIDAVKTLQQSDPKLLLRVGKKTPHELMKAAMDCIGTGLGNPLFSNDEVVIPQLVNFGYEAEDAFNYVTSACWEPLVPGVAHEQNNLTLFNFLLPIKLLDEKEGLEKYHRFEDLFEAYCMHLRGHVAFMSALLNDIVWENDPYVSTFTMSCREKHKDVGQGGGKYNNYGILSVAMSNAVNSLLILKKYVFEKRMFTMAELNLLRRNNYRTHEDVRQFLLNQKYYGTDNEEAIELTKAILNVANDELGKYRNKFGGRYKFGLSSPGYIVAAKDFEASFDGRRIGDPFAVHISGDDGESVTELMKFASELDYSGSCFNGNVVDFFVTPNLLERNKDKFAQFIKDSLDMGVFQTQMNVVSSSTLIAARKNPENFPNLIVRVWGFSAYYVDLPDVYKDYLIERALKCEKVA